MKSFKHASRITLLASLACLTACTGRGDIPKQVNGQPVRAVPFEQPLTLKPEMGQDFYFYFKGREQKSQKGYIIGVTFLIPADDDKLISDVDKWSFFNHETNKPGEDNLHFEVKAEYHVGRKTVRIPLQYALHRVVKYTDMQDGSEWHRMWNRQYAISGTDKIMGGRVMIPFQSILTFLTPADMPAEPHGFYKVSIRPADGIRYPDIPFEMFVEKIANK